MDRVPYLAGLSFLAAVIASVVGTGGGSLFIPAFSLAYPDDVHKVVPLSKAAVFGVAVGSCCINIVSLFRRRDGRLRPEIDLQLATLIQPATLFGAIVGVLLNLALSSLVISLALLVILSLTAFKTIQSANRQRLQDVAKGSSKETFDLVLTPTPDTRYHADDFELSPSSSISRLSTYRGLTEPHGSDWRSASLEPTSFDTPKPQRVKNIDTLEPTPQYYMATELTTSEAVKEIAKLVAVWMINLTLLTLSGGPAALVCGNSIQRMMMASLLCFHFLFVAFTQVRLQQKGKYTENLRWASYSHMTLYCLLSASAGLAAGLLGIGGGLIKGPLLIHIGLSPINAVATSNYMIFFTSSSNVVSYALAGRLDGALSVGIAAVTLAGSSVGTLALRRIFSSGNRQAILTYLLGASIMLGGLLMFGVNLKETLVNRGEGSHESTLGDACAYLTSMA